MAYFNFFNRASFPLHSAVEKGELSTVLNLINNDSKVEKRENVLQSAEPIINQLNKSDITPLGVAVRNSQYAVAALLIDKNANLNIDKNPSLLAIAYNKGKTLVRLFILHNNLSKVEIYKDYKFAIKRCKCEAATAEICGLKENKLVHERILKKASVQESIAAQSALELGKIYLKLADLEWKERARAFSEEKFADRQDQYELIVYFYIGKVLSNLIQATNFYSAGSIDATGDDLRIVQFAGDFCREKLNNRVLAQQFYALADLITNKEESPVIYDTAQFSKIWINKFDRFTAISDHVNQLHDREISDDSSQPLLDSSYTRMRQRIR